MMTIHTTESTDRGLYVVIPDIEDKMPSLSTMKHMWISLLLVCITCQVG